MKAEQVDQALRQRFVLEGERLVFWHDEKADFVHYVADGLTGELANVKVLDVAQVGGLPAKLLLEREDPSGKYLVYSAGEVPPPDEDWLLDIRLYSAQFHADVASLWLQELGLNRLSLRGHLKERSAFLASQERRRKLRRQLTETDDEAAIDLKMLAVLLNTPVASTFDVLRYMCHNHRSDERFDLDRPPEVLATIEKMGLLPRFWDLMRSEFAYSAEEPSVAGLLRRVFVSEVLHQAGGDRLASIAHYRLPASGQRNAVVFLTQWRDSTGNAASYDAAAAAVGAEQKIGETLGALDLTALKDVYTFFDAERLVIKQLRDQILQEGGAVDVEFVAELASQRKAGHWLSGPGRDAAERQAMSHAYDAMVAAAELFRLQAALPQELRFEAPADLLEAYQASLFQLDRLYRHFCWHAKPAVGQGWDLLKALAVEVERVYDQGFLQRLGVEWSRLLDQGFLSTWSLKALPPQQEFYARNIGPYVREGDRRRAFVIISDAFRYEAATELVEQLNGKYRMGAELQAMLGVLPSYTKLGMASLLPHKTLAYNEKGEVLVDGKSAEGTAARSKHLATVDGIACQAKDLRAMPREEAREMIQDARVVYIYHNVIDARGDSASTEAETFEAVAECLDELEELVQYCVNKLNAAKVWVTADHGFLYQHEALDDTDKSKLSHKPKGALVVKKRYVLGYELGGVPEAHHGSTYATAVAEGSMEFWVPRAANRFHFAGGARFIHGGAMPQEVVVPLVMVTNVRGKQKEGTRIEKVAVQVLGTNHKITTPKYRFELIQTEAVSERRKPITLRAAVYEGEQPVTSVETVTFDSACDSIEERKKSIRLELRTGTFNKATSYRLILRDVETDVEVQSVPVVIDRSFDDDF